MEESNYNSNGKPKNVLKQLVDTGSSNIKKLVNTKILKSVVKNQSRKLRDNWRKIMTGNAQKRVRDHLREKESSPKMIKFNDKLAFTFGLLNICVTQHFLLNKGGHFWKWYSIVMPMLMFVRFKNYTKLGWHYFMLDFCYFTLWSTFACMYVIRNSPAFFKMVFIFANGPLTVAIIAWRNSLVFHDYEKMTSVFIHILPCLLTYSLHWHASGDPSYEYCQETMTYRDFLNGCIGYVVWQCLYYAKTEVIDKDKLDSDPKLLTSLRWLSSDKKNSMNRAVLGLCKKVRLFAVDEEFDSRTVKTKVVFMASQFVYTLITFLPTLFLYWSHTLHLSYIIFIFSTAVYYGAGYYIEVFSARYQLQFENKTKIQQVAETAAVAAYNLASQNRLAHVANKMNGSGRMPAGGNMSRQSSTRSDVDSDGGAVTAGGLGVSVDGSHGSNGITLDTVNVTSTPNSPTIGLGMDMGMERVDSPELGDMDTSFVDDMDVDLNTNASTNAMADSHMSHLSAASMQSMHEEHEWHHAVDREAKDIITEVRRRCCMSATQSRIRSTVYCICCF